MTSELVGFMSAGEYLAAYGALVSSIALGWNIYRALSDRGKLSVRCRFQNGGNIAMGPGAYRMLNPATQVVLFWEITNVGRRPLMVQTLGPVIRGKPLQQEAAGLPKVLAPEEQAVFETPLTKSDAAQVSSLSVWDTRGREYRASREDLAAVQHMNV